MTTSDLKTRPPVSEWPAQAAARAIAEGEPEWALERRRRAARRAAELPLPDRGDELWRRTDFGSLALETLDPFAPGAPVRSLDEVPAILDPSRDGAPRHSGVFAQRNNAAGLVAADDELLARGVIVASLEGALRQHGALLEPRLFALIEAGQDKFTALHQALHSGGAFVWVPDGAELEQPIRLTHWLDGAGMATHPATVVVLGKGARATVIEQLASATAEGLAFYNGTSEVFVGEGAKLVYATLQDWGRNVFHYSNRRARIERGGELQWIQTLLGGRMVKDNSYFDLAGPGAQAFVHGFMFGDHRQHFHLHTLQRHLVDHTTSDLLIKGCLKDRARSVYQGLIQVSEGAQRTDAYQANRNLLLSDQARADSIPGLEILANDVRCTHGATIGHVDDEQMYYLMARGLPRRDAQRLIVEGFFAPVLDRIPLESVREQLRQVIQQKIG
jgi:Fe-S cluster assembly protein SufD